MVNRYLALLRESDLINQLRYVLAHTDSLDSRHSLPETLRSML
jgi:hypothetical protein